MSWSIRPHQSDVDIRTAALLALGKNRAPEALNRLQAVAENKEELPFMRIQAIRALGHSASESVVLFLTKLAEQEPSLAYSIYAALDRLSLPSVLPSLEKGLIQQVERRQVWRKHRSTWQETLNDEKNQDKKDEWVGKLKNLQPNPALETWFAQQIARIDPKRADELIRHDLYAVRQGAWLGIVRNGDINWLGKLTEQHAKESNPLFRFAQYQAIDLLLERLAVLGTAKDLEHLRSIDVEWTTKLDRQRQIPKSEWTDQQRVQETILQRMKWTLSVLQNNVGTK